MTARIVPDGEHVVLTNCGVDLISPHTRAVTVNCNCGTTLKLQLLSDDTVDDQTADTLLSAYLHDRGWTPVDNGEVIDDKCPNCVDRGTESA